MKLFDFELFTGSKGNLLNVSDMSKLVLGVVAVIFASVGGQWLASQFDNFIPGNQSKIKPFIDRKPIASGVPAVTITRV
jgi:Na+-transporting methylmalonyl-CoA/oxaloacetate decarboxylase beta subunit